MWEGSINNGRRKKRANRKNSKKQFFKKQDIYVNINDQRCKVIGRVGTYHLTCDITGKNINIGDKVKININPKFVNSDVRREYK